MPGAGNCFNGGDPEVLYDTFAMQLARLPDSTRVYPGPRVPRAQPRVHARPRADNQDAAGAAHRGEDAARPARRRSPRSAQEKRINSFFRLQNPEVIARLRARFPDIDERPDPETVFVRLRELRNRW